MLQRVGPKPLIEPEKLKNEADWIEAGRRVFEEADHLHLRTLDSKIIAAVRSLETFKNAELIWPRPRSKRKLPTGPATRRSKKAPTSMWRTVEATRSSACDRTARS